MKKHHAKNAHKDGHPHHKNEMSHHKMRDHAHAANKSMHHKEHGTHKHAPIHEMGANPTHLIGGTSHDNHQEGISRVKQRSGSMPVGQHGSMADGWRHERHKE